MNAAIYARKSTEQHGADADSKSVARQIENARTFALAKGWRVEDAHVYSDDAISGAETKKLVNRQRLLDALGGGRPPFQALIMRDASRFSRRDGDEAFGELKRIAQAGVEIHFYQDGTRFAFGAFADNVVGFVRAEMNAEYRRQVAKWTHEAMLRKAKAGYVCGGACFGYDNVRVDGHVERVINEAEAAIVHKIFTMSAAGAGYARIAKELNADGVAAPNPRTGRPTGWGTSTIYEILHRPRYRGEVIYNKTRRRAPDGTTTFAARPESEWIRVEREDLRIVSPELWTAAHARLTSLRTRLERSSEGRYPARRRDVDSKYLLSGFARCATCGGTVCPVDPRRYGCLVHHKRGTTICDNAVTLPIARLEQRFLAELRKRLQPESILAAVELLFERFAPATRAREAARSHRELQQLDREIGNLTKAIAQGGDFPTVLAALKTAHARREELTATIAAQTAVDVRRIDRPRLEAEIREVLATWQTTLAANVARTRQLLREILVRLTLTPKDGAYLFEGELLLGGLLTGGTGTPLLARPGAFDKGWALPFSGIAA